MTEIADAAVRARALAPEQSFIVGAPAGSGKTTLLTQRFLRLLSLVEQPESIVAITFTRKAAEEMRSRVLAALRSVRDGATDLDPVTRTWAEAALAASDAGGWRLLDNPRRLRMQTIDSLAAAIARRGPLLSGFAGNVAMLDDARPVYEQAARAAIAELGAADVWSAAVETLLAHLDNNWERLESLLAEMLGRRDQWLRFVIETPTRVSFERALTRAVTAELRGFAAALPSHCAADIVRLATFAGTNIQLLRPDDQRALLAGMRALPGFEIAALPLWRALTQVFLTGEGKWRRRVTVNEGFSNKAAGFDEHKALFFSLVDELQTAPGALEALGRIRELPDPAYTESDWACLDALFSVLKLAAAQLQLEFDHAGAVDFAQVGQAAAAALGGLQAPSELQLVLDYQLQHLLVDEFQDTSIAQFELIERLVDGWGPDDGRSLFLVGDPMQSIYRFREADVSLFVDTAAAGRLGSVPLESLQLTTNFRAQAGLIEWLNDTVATLREVSGGPFAALPRLVAARPPAGRDAVRVHGVVADEAADEMDTVVNLVNASVAAEPGRRIGILVRSRTHLGRLGEKLMNAGVAVVASDIDALGTQAIVLDLVALTRALLHLEDRTAWLAILRAPWCGLTLRELTGLFEDARTVSVLERLRETVRAGDCDVAREDRLLSLLATIERYLPLAGREPVADLVEAAWLALDGPSCYPAQDLRHAARYFDLLTLNADRIDVLSAQRLAGLLDREYVAPPAQAAAVVEIMTIHAAKGLEFDVVIMPGLGRRPRAQSRRLLEWRAHHTAAGTELLFAPIEATGASSTPINGFLRAAEQREAHDEAHRLLYVALTRAREVLHLVGSVKRDDDDALAPPPSGSFYRMLWPSVCDQISRVEEATAVPAPAASQRQQLRRIANPAPALLSTPGAADSVLLSGRFGLEFSWASPLAKHIGTVTHAVLQRISGEGPAAWPAMRVAELAPAIERRLRAVGVAPGAIGGARTRILDAIGHALGSERGRWILSDEHADCHSEYALTSLTQGHAVNVVIDRTFIDRDGRRWIIDFKTGIHAGGSPDAFIDSEVERYRPQLERYAALMRRRETCAIRLGLFFPLLDEWREWGYDDAATESGTGTKV
jgi:ATP-dependent exoDNAse (exonuclease V) beta subunit